MKEPYSKIITVTPDQAIDILEHSAAPNRKMRREYVGLLRNAMENGQWKLNGEALIFRASDGKLMDGQHRLYACALAKVPLTTLATYNVDDDSFDTLGGGRKRGLKDIFEIQGEKLYTTLAATVRKAVYIDRDNTTNWSGSISVITLPNLQEYLAKNKKIRLSVQMVTDAWNANKSSKSIMNGSMLAALHYTYLKYNPKSADVLDGFVSGMYAGFNPTKFPNYHKLRELLIANQISHVKLLRNHIAHLAMQALNATIRGEKLAKLVIDRDIPSPTIINRKP